jgi:hypothetical protein
MACAGHRRDAVHPGRLQYPEVRADAHPAVGGEHDSLVRGLHPRGQCVDEGVPVEGTVEGREDLARALREVPGLPHQVDDEAGELGADVLDRDLGERRA